jgi:hypothetical protein
LGRFREKRFVDFAPAYFALWETSFDLTDRKGIEYRLHDEFENPFKSNRLSAYDSLSVE